MTVLGTSVAAGVAQTGLQAQQVGRHGDRATAQTTDEARRLRDRFQASLLALEEDDSHESPANLKIDSGVPQHQSGQQRQPNQKRRQGEPAPTDTPAAATPPSSAQSKPASPQTDSPLYRHVDIQA